MSFCLPLDTCMCIVFGYAPTLGYMHEPHVLAVTFEPLRVSPAAALIEGRRPPTIVISKTQSEQSPGYIYTGHHPTSLRLPPFSLRTLYAGSAL